MVKAELSHNPYLLITKVKFNGQEPRINSQIEKYDTKPLKNWVHLVPGIFYNEMNGYDFDLNFTGTKSDFAEIKVAFENAGVTPDQVRIFHKNEIEEADIKSEEIDNLIKWLKNNPNRKFNFNEFWKINSDLFESTYPLVIINGDFSIDVDQAISIEKVKSAYELKNINLTSIPVLFIIDSPELDQFKKDLVLLLSRDDVRQEQLFFIIDAYLEENYVIRMISDFGVKKPQIVRNSDENIVQMYIRNYPVTEYVRKAIKVFSSVSDHIGNILEAENEASEITNAGIRTKLHELESDLGKLKEAEEFFAQRDNYNPPQIFIKVQKEFEEQLFKWKNRKMKIFGDDEADRYAKDFSDYINKILTAFFENTLDIFQQEAKTIESAFSAVYVNGTVNEEYIPESVVLNTVEIGELPDIAEGLLQEKDISYEAAKADFFGLFKKSDDNAIEMVKVVTCYLDKWRAAASELVMPVVERMIKNCQNELQNYYESLAESYRSHLSELIAEKQAIKEEATSQLSDDERKLQEDNDWLTQLNDQLQIIERG